MKGDEFSDGDEQEVIGRPIHHLLKLHRVDLVKLKAFTIVLEALYTNFVLLGQREKCVSRRQLVQ